MLFPMQNKSKTHSTDPIFTYQPWWQQLFHSLSVSSISNWISMSENYGRSNWTETAKRDEKQSKIQMHTIANNGISSWVFVHVERNSFLCNADTLLVCIHRSFGFVTKTKFQLTKKRKYSISELFECSRMQTRVKQKHSYHSLAAENARSEGKALKSGQRNEILH